MAYNCQFPFFKGFSILVRSFRKYIDLIRSPLTRQFSPNFRTNWSDSDDDSDDNKEHHDQNDLTLWLW